MTPIFSEKELNLYQNIINLTQEEIREVMVTYLKKIYKENLIENDSYIYAVGDIPIALVAHMDTVFEDTKDANSKTRNVILYYDQYKETIACPLGAGHDDRAGIYAIYKIVQSGLRPSIVLTTDEEIGGIGARIFVQHFPKPLSEIKYVIELDRRGQNDCVFYDLDYKEFEEYIESFGFATNWGSFSDIGVICPKWGIAGVNLSIGYDNEHSTREVLHVNWWLSTINRVKTMLTQTDIKAWKYIEMKYTYNYGNFMSYYGLEDYYDDDYYRDLVKCSHCGAECSTIEMRPLLNEKGTLNYYCLNCYDSMHNCMECNKPFYKLNKAWKYCKACAKEHKNK